ncbi:hypothetical protein [Pedobacter nyackensis]|uniref:Uncharacterized protein n=1 Tax=Pedobacter nyackensis TaxID=475255 RepID=A0A1W1ZVU7_9SPHI|nr:hypothetical protein [Pedobacter nyackensis]SMC52493.1 hypothetical protein SAMN04488101_10188 [Pedobacter nyackensis]
MKPNENLNLFLQPKAEIAVLPIENKSILTSDKSELSYMASLILQGVDDGYADPMDTLLMAKKGMYVFKGIVEGLEGKVAVPEKGYTKHHCTIREQMTGVKYHFEECNDPVWTELYEQFKAIEFQLKERQEWLKTFKKPTEVEAEIDEDTGEEISPARKINPPVKMGGMSIIISIKNEKDGDS